MSTTTTSDIRDRRERIGVTRLQLAARSGVSLTHLASIEGGLRPSRSRVREQVLAALDDLEHGEAA